MRCQVFLALLVATAASAESYLVNPSFDEVDARGEPKRWDLFVMPMEGAYGRLDSDAADGAYCAVLHIPTKYAEEPVNNWSQNIIHELGGKEIHVSGRIKTRDATEAALLLQCWRRNSRRPLATVTTSVEYPTYGTKDWSRVEASLTVPDGTAYLVLRCLLKGRGTAWFDDLRVDDRPYGKPLELTLAEPSDEESGAKENSRSKRATLIETLMEANEALRQSLDAITAMNKSLLRQVDSLQSKLDALKRELSPANAPIQLETLEPPQPGETHESGAS